MTEPTFIDAFAGIGGLGLGFELAGWKCTAHIEKDPDCRRVLERHFPDAPTYGDIRDVGPDELATPDALVGGFPCQDVSVAGSRKGLAGRRSGLWHEFHRLAGALAPRWVLIENVPGLLSSHDGADFAIVLRGLVELGYGWSYRILDSQYFGVAQRRRRVFVVGCLGGVCPPEVLFEQESVQRNPAASDETRAAIAGQTLSRSLGRVGGGDDPGANKGTLISIFDQEQGLAPHGSCELREKASTLDKNEFKGKKVVVGAYTISPETGQGADLVARPTDKASALSPTGEANKTERGTRVVDVMASGQANTEITRDISPTLNLNRDGAPIAFRKAQKAHHPDDCEHWKEADRANVLDAGGHGPRTASAVLENSAPRRLTPVECERLQAFPDGWTAGASDSVRYRQLGNAVTVTVAHWIATRMKAANEKLR